MALKMFDEVLRKLRFETELLALVVAFSLPVSLFLIADAAIGLVVERYGSTLTVLKVFELAFAVTWLFLSTSTYREINQFRKTYYKAYSLHKSEGLDEEQKRSEAAELVRNIMGFYRDNYLKFSVILTLAIAISFLVITEASYLVLYGSMSFWVAVFRWAFNSLMLLIVSVLYVYVYRGWRRKLLKVKDAERKLSEILGGPIES
jgi:hypothetical protein